MAYLIGPSEASRLVFTISATAGTTKGFLKGKAARTATYYDDPDPSAEPTPSMLTSPAAIRTLAGVLIPDSTVTIDAYSMLPLMRFPEGTPPPDSLLIVVDGGPPARVFAQEDARLDALADRVDDLDTSVAGVETPAGAQAKATAAQAAAIAAAATDATAKASAAQTAAISAAATDATSKASAAQAAAVQRGNHTGTQAIATVTGLQAALDAKAVKLPAVVYVNDYVPGGTDITAVNCLPYFTAARDAAGVGGMITYSGRFRIDGEFALLNYQELRGVSTQLGGGSSVTTNCLDFRQIGGSAVGIRVAAGNVLRDMRLAGPGFASVGSRAVSTGDADAQSPRFYNVQFYNWEKGAHLYGAYYTRFWDCAFQYCGTGIYADLCYNLNVFGTRFTCRNDTNTAYGTGIYVNGAIRPLKIFGGSFEDFAVAIRVANGSSVSVDGTYFEDLNFPGTNAGIVGGVGIQADGITGTTIHLQDCLVYMQNMDSWLRALTGSLRVTAQNNKFIYDQVTPGPPTTTPQFYRIGNSIGDVHIFGDDTNAVYTDGTQQYAYTNNAFSLGAVANYHVRYPSNEASGRGSNFYEGSNILVASGKLVQSEYYRMPNISEPATPTAGGIIWVQGGALKYKGSSGTVTTLGPA